MPILNLSYAQLRHLEFAVIKHLGTISQLDLSKIDPDDRAAFVLDQAALLKDYRAILNQIIDAQHVYPGDPS